MLRVAAFLLVVAALTTSAAFSVPDDKAAFSVLAHKLLNVKPGTSRVDADGIPVVPLSLVDVTVTPASLPIHARVAYGTRPQTEAHFSWTSFDGISPATVLVGTHSGDYELEPVTAASPLTYGAGDACGPMKNWKNPGECPRSARVSARAPKENNRDGINARACGWAPQPAGFSHHRHRLLPPRAAPGAAA